MFESDDWDFDQDFLNDVDDKAVKFYSQTDNQEIEPKRRKIEVCNDASFSLDSDVDLHDKKTFSKQITNPDKSKELRKNLILGMFNKNDSQTCDSKKLSNNTLLKPKSNDTQNYEDSQLPRKNLVLGILKNKNIQDKVIQNNIKNVNPQKVEAKIKSNTNTTINQGPKSLNTNKIKHQTSKNNYQRENGFSNDNSKSNAFQTSRKELLCNIMKPQTVNNIKPKSNVITNALSITKYPQDQVQSNKKMTLIRKFPGPAGLLPDDIDANIPPVSYLNSLEENEKTNEESNTSKLPEYCSQNTKNLFTEGAWQLMLDDLPHDFLKGYEIAIVKQMASTKGCNSTKVKYLAGIIERIDHSHENPPIVLRDFTDNIQGIVHRDIPLKYPGLLEPNVVVLLQDVGLLKTSSTFVSNKYQILISPSSLLGIYTNKGEIERTHQMASILENISKEETNKEQKKNEDCVFLKPLEVHSSETNLLKHNSNIHELVNSKKNTENVKSKSVGTNLNKSTEHKNESMDFDVDFSFSPTKITNSQNQKNFNGSTFKKHTNETSKQENPDPFLEKQQEDIHNDDKERAKELLKALKRFSSSENSKKRFSFNSKGLHSDAEQRASTEQVEEKVLGDTFSEQMNINDCDINTSQQKVESATEEIVSPSCSKTESVQLNNSLQSNKPSIRSRLLQFKNTETSTTTSVEPQTVSNSKEIGDTFKETKSSESSSFFNDVLRNTENDSDDEMLSQLDMDTIFSNYNNKN